MSNPYLSQIERGLRRPSAEVLQQLSKALRVSAESLYVRAGILDPEDHPASTVEMAVLADTAISERHKQVLLDVYRSFVAEEAARPRRARPRARRPTLRPTTPRPRRSTMPKHDEPDLTPFYAVAGLADVIADLFRESVAARQRKAEERLAEIRDRRLERVEQARVNADELREFLSTLPEQVRALPETTRLRLAELQRQAEELVAQANDTYSSLAGRGKRVVDDRVSDVKTAGRAARRVAEDGLDDAAEAVQPLVDDAQEAVTEVRRNVTGRAARVRTPAKPVDDVTPESATQAARAAAAKAGGTTTPTVADAEVSPAQALAQENEAKKAGQEVAAPEGPGEEGRRRGTGQEGGRQEGARGQEGVRHEEGGGRTRPGRPADAGRGCRHAELSRTG